MSRPALAGVGMIKRIIIYFNNCLALNKCFIFVQVPAQIKTGEKILLAFWVSQTSRSNYVMKSWQLFDHPSKKLVILFGTKTIPVQFKSDKRKGKLDLCKILTEEEQGIVWNNANNDMTENKSN